MTDRNQIAANFVEVAQSNSDCFQPVVRFSLESPYTTRLDLSISNPRVAALDIEETGGLSKFIDAELIAQRARAGIGGYNEKRAWYARSSVFKGEEVRSIHLGIDIWSPAGTAVYTPLDGKVHSFKDNAQFGDYGPTIILEHQLESITFYTLYGHLSRESLASITSVGMHIMAGTRIGEFGAPPINGDWPPHLHFQIMLDMLDYQGDYPGVAAESRRTEFLNLCPNPNLILQSKLI